MGSLSGADASQRVTEAFTKVGYPGMEIREIVQTQKPAWLQGWRAEQRRKSKLVNWRVQKGDAEIIG